MRLYMCACERCGKEVPATLAGYAKMVLRNSARIDGQGKGLVPGVRREPAGVVPRRRGEAGRKGIAMGIICDTCGRDIDALGQDNMSCTCEPLCEDCWNEQQSHAVAVLRRENDRLRGDLAEMGRKLAEARQRLRSDGRRTASGCAARSRRPTR